MTVQEPFSPAQIEHASKILATVTQAASPKQLNTATGTAKAFRYEWNKQEYSALFNQQPSMGGIMTPGVANSVVRGLSNKQVQSRAELLLPNGRVVEPTAVNKPAKKGGRKPKPVQALVPIETVTEEILSSCTANRLLEFIDEYRKLPGMASMPKPRTKPERIAAIMNAKNKYTSNSSN